MMLPGCVFTCLFAYLLALSAVVAAQTNPTDDALFELRPDRIALGESSELIVRDLAPGDVVYRLTGPGGAERGGTIPVGEDGTARATLEPSAVGGWTLRVSAPGSGGAVRDARLQLTVGPPPAEPEPGTDPTADPTPANAPETSPPSDVESTEESGASPTNSTDPPTDPPNEERSSDTDGGAEGVGDVSESAGSAVYRLDGSDLIAERDGAVAWRLPFPAGSGPTGALLVEPDGLTLGHGLSLLRVDPASGAVRARAALPAPATAIERVAPGELRVVTTFDSGPREPVTVRDEARGQLEVAGPVRFGADPGPFGWLETEARASDDPAARLERDPTNPWLHLLVADATDQSGADAEAGYRDAVARAATFFDLARLGEALRERGELELANDAVDRALRDFASREYTPDLLFSPALTEAYGFPLQRLRAALGRGDTAAADFWAPWAYRSVAPGVPGAREALRSYADALAARGQADAAELWRARANEFRQRRVSEFLDAVAVRVATLGWWGPASVLAAGLLALIALVAKYWKPQSLVLERSRSEGRRPGRFARLFAPRYFTFTERLFGVLLLATVLALAGLARWSERSGDLPGAAGSGTLVSPPVLEFLDGSLRDTPEAALARGYAAQVRGDADLAERAYREAGDLPAALNNLGALLDDGTLYRRALERAPGLRAASYNLGRSTSPSPFHERYRPGEPLLVAPSALDLRAALAGSWERAVSDAFVRPWRTFDRAAPGLVRGAWFAVLIGFGLVALVAVLALFAPRPRPARSAPRGWLYPPLALLIPGSGQADELWGLLLTIPWALLGCDALLQWLGGASALGLELRTELVVLGAIYLINLVAWTVELVSYTRRMRALKREQPELARRYGMTGG